MHAPKHTERLLAEVLDIFKPVKDIGHVEGLPRSN